jgi:hypothetical protein
MVNLREIHGTSIHSARACGLDISFYELAISPEGLVISEIPAMGARPSVQFLEKRPHAFPALNAGPNRHSSSVTLKDQLQSSPSRLQTNSSS